MGKNYFTRYNMKIQNSIAIVRFLLNFIRYFCLNISHFVGLSIQKLEIIKNSFHFDKMNKENI
jgi:hypothetical protein